jgi:hypothetical protein
LNDLIVTKSYENSDHKCTLMILATWEPEIRTEVWSQPGQKVREIPTPSTNWVWPIIPARRKAQVDRSLSEPDPRQKAGDPI